MASFGHMLCANPACKFLAHENAKLAGSFCCKRCHSRWSGRGKLDHGRKCGAKEAPSGAARAPVIEPPEPLELTGTRVVPRGSIGSMLRPRSEEDPRSADKRRKIPNCDSSRSRSPVRHSSSSKNWTYIWHSSSSKNWTYISGGAVGGAELRGRYGEMATERVREKAAMNKRVDVRVAEPQEELSSQKQRRSRSLPRKRSNSMQRRRSAEKEERFQRTKRSASRHRSRSGGRGGPQLRRHVSERQTLRVKCTEEQPSRVGKVPGDCRINHEDHCSANPKGRRRPHCDASRSRSRTRHSKGSEHRACASRNGRHQNDDVESLSPSRSRSADSYDSNRKGASSSSDVEERLQERLQRLIDVKQQHEKGVASQRLTSAAAHATDCTTAEAADQLINAMRSGCILQLRRSLDTCCLSAKSDRAWTLAAQRLEKLQSVRWDLNEAMHAGDLEVLGRALLAAKDAGLVDPEVEKAQNRWIELDACRRQLREDTQGSNIFVLSRSIAKAAGVGLKDSAVQEGKQRLQSLHQMKENVLLAMDAGLVAPLKTAVASARAVGLDDIEREGNEKLAKLHEARDNLRNAVASGRISLLSEAIDASSATGLEDDIIDEARDKLLRLRLCRQGLVAACDSGKINSIRDCLSKAVELGLDDDTMDSSIKTLHRLELVLETPLEATPEGTPIAKAMPRKRRAPDSCRRTDTTESNEMCSKASQSCTTSDPEVSRADGPAPSLKRPFARCPWKKPADGHTQAHSFYVNQEVSMRDKHEFAWHSGVVTSVEPLLVRFATLSDITAAYEWDEVRQKDQEPLDDDPVPETNEGDSSSCSNDRLETFQVQILRKCAAGVKQLDPSQNPSAEKTWAHRIEQISVMDLHGTHADVSDRFLNGRHKDLPIESLFQELQIGVTAPADLPPLVAARYEGEHWVVFGNRRLLMLKRHATIQDRPVYMRVIVHDWQGAGITPEKLRLAFVAKFVLASTASRQPGLAEVQVRQHAGSSRTRHCQQWQQEPVRLIRPSMPPLFHMFQHLFK